MRPAACSTNSWQSVHNGSARGHQRNLRDVGGSAGPRPVHHAPHMTWIFMHRVPHGECPHMPHRARWVKRSSQCRRPFTWQRGRAPRQHRTPDQPDRSVHQSGIPLLSVTATVRDNAHRSGWASSRKHWPYKAWSRILSFRHFPPSPFRGDLIDLPCPGTRGHLNYSSGCGGRSPYRPR